ncbi:MAG: hypothetical protein F6K31_41945 [Symploca sp. SIO2G7]|nr:hypothetical protein [Symploca sp. SIO2G7]
MGKILQRLRLVVVHSTEVYIFLNVNESPFNVGVPIELPEFTQEQVRELAQQYELDCTVSEVEQLQGLVGGHPCCQLYREYFRERLRKMNHRDTENTERIYGSSGDIMPNYHKYNPNVLLHNDFKHLALIENKN